MWRRSAAACVLTVALAAGLAAGLAPAPPAAASAAHRAPVPTRLAALRWAEAQAGKPYIFGGMGPAGFDCSGLVVAAYAHAGVRLPRTSYALAADSAQLRFIPVSQAQRGDILFFGTGHVELKTRPWNGSFGALQTGTPVGWHRWSGWWVPTMAAEVR